MHARVNTFQGPPDRVDEIVGQGHRDHAVGERTGPGESEEKANSLRQQSAEAGGEDILGVERFEVVVDERA